MHSFYSLQGFTGVLLSFNYAPTPGEAYNSLKFIITELTGGRLIRGLHHWGASLMIVIVFLHMTQVFLYGAYKKPREVLPLLLEKRKGRIINISSVAGKIGITHGVAYTASKHGLLGLTRALATEVASHDITTPPSPWG